MDGEGEMTVGEGETAVVSSVSMLKSASVRMGGGMKPLDEYADVDDAILLHVSRCAVC